MLCCYDKKDFFKTGKVMSTDKKIITPTKPKITKKKLYKDDLEAHFNIRYLTHCELKDPRLLKWDIFTDKEYTNNQTLNDRLAMRYGHLIEEGYIAPMYIKWVNKTVEYGAYADRDIKRGELITEYTGILEEDIYFDDDNLYLWDYPTIFYEEQPGKKRRKKIKFCVNAEKTGNFARFINHSLKKYQNVGTMIAPHNNLWHVLYIAQKDIQKGQQLLTHYGSAYWQDRKIVPFPITPNM